MGETGRRATKAHALAKIVPSLLTERTGATVDTRLDSDALPDLQGRHTRCDGGDNPGSFMSKHKRCAHSKIPVSSMGIVVHCN